MIDRNVDAPEGLSPVNGEIAHLLDRIERDHGLRILYACESGSRAWGFASPDSDYDIRFLFARREAEYLRLSPPTDAIDLPLEGELDAGGWDLRKAALLLGKSNGAVVEWLHSPIVYRESSGFLDRWRSMATTVFLPRNSADHYRGMAKQMLKVKLVGDTVRAKDYLYALRAILAARWVLEGRGIPPVPFAGLLPVASDEVRALVPDLLARKAATAESERMERLTGLDEFLQSSLTEIEQGIAGLPQQATDSAVFDPLVRLEIRGGRPVAPVASFSLARIRESDLLFFDTVAGSHAYGTAVEGSDEDRRGIFVAPNAFLVGLETIEQVSDERNDETYYELGRFVEMLLKNNPNALELLGMPDDCVRFRHPLFDELRPALFLSKLCARTFGEYAMGQIRKARGLNKKIVNPQPEQRHPLLHFCRVPVGQGSVPVVDWLRERGLAPVDCGLTAVQGAAGMFAIYHDRPRAYRGIVSRKDPDALVFSSVSKDAEPIGWMSFNEDAFKAHCKAHREYWDWVAKRNEERYAMNAAHGRGYDSKNLLHTLRLLDMAGEIARDGVIRVRRPNRDFLLKVRAGSFSYDELVGRAEKQLEQVLADFECSALPDAPDRGKVNEVLVGIRRAFGED
jgi:predicted nucleotidyltransferase